MAVKIAVATTRAGSSSTYWAVSYAWTLASVHRKRVLLIDLDMAGGTIADLLQLDDRGSDGMPQGHSVGNLATGRGQQVSVIDLEQQIITVPSLPFLRVIPGLRQQFGGRTSEALRAMGDALGRMRDDVVICDIGQALCYPGLDTPAVEAEEIARVFNRFFIVIRDDPALAARTVEVLRIARPPHAKLIVCTQRHRQLKEHIHRTIERHVGNLPIAGEWAWDERRATRMGDTGTPMVLKNLGSELSV